LSCYGIAPCYNVINKQPMFQNLNTSMGALADGAADVALAAIDSLGARCNMPGNKEVSSIATSLAYRNPYLIYALINISA
jgi:hypothetical protein